MNRMIWDSPDLAQRVEKLEKANRRLKLAGVLVLTLIGCLLLLGAASPKRTVEAEAFILRDANGKVRAMLRMFEGMPILAFNNADGQVRMGLSLSAEGAGLMLFDTDGQAQVRLGMSAAGTKLAFRSAKGKVQVVLGMTASNKPQLVLLDANGKVIFIAP